MNNDKKHADFQDRYTKSSNFDKLTKDENFKADGKGNVIKADTDNTLSENEKRDIANAMDNMQRNIEMIPGGERSEEE